MLARRLQPKVARRRIMVLAPRDEYDKISAAAAAAKMSRSAWLRVAAEEKIRDARRDGRAA